MNLYNDQLSIETEGNEILVESPDAFAILSFHPVLVKQIEKEFNDETTLGDIIFLTQSLGFHIETKYLGKEP